MIWTARDRRKMSSERLEDRVAQRFRSGSRDDRLGRPDHERHQGQEQEREAPEHGAPSDPFADRDGDGARDQRGRAVERHAGAHREALLLPLEHLDRVTVDRDVLGGRPEGDEHRDRGNRDDVGIGGLGREQCDPREEKDLADDHPGALAAQKRQPVAVHEGSPEELERPRGLREREESDGLDVDAAIRQPGGQRDPDETEREARRKGLKGDGADPAGAESGAQALDGARARGPSRRRLGHPPKCRTAFLTRSAASGVVGRPPGGSMKIRTIAVLAGALASAWLGAAEPAKSSASTSSPVLAPLDAIYPDLEKLYLDLHQTPELSVPRGEDGGEDGRAAARSRIRGDHGGRKDRRGGGSPQRQRTHGAAAHGSRRAPGRGEDRPSLREQGDDDRRRAARRCTSCTPAGTTFT